MRTLAEYVTQRREELGLNQKQLAERGGLPANMVNRIEKGVTKLPSPDFRRKLAAGLEVTHLDVLVAAGELEPDEAKGAGAVLTEDVAVPPTLRSALADIDWSRSDALTTILPILRLVATNQRLQAGTQQLRSPDEVERNPSGR